MKYYIEYTRVITEVYEVDANRMKEAEEKVRKNHNRNAPNIVDSKETEHYRVVNGKYKDGKLKEQFAGFYD